DAQKGCDTVETLRDAIVDPIEPTSPATGDRCDVNSECRKVVLQPNVEITRWRVTAELAKIIQREQRPEEIELHVLAPPHCDLGRSVTEVKARLCGDRCELCECREELERAEILDGRRIDADCGHDLPKRLLLEFLKGRMEC